MNDFAFSDLGRVHWGSTLKLLVARSFFAGLVWTIIVSIGPNAVSGEDLLLTPFVVMLVGLPTALLCHFAGMFLPFGLLIQLFGSLFVCAGDPIVYLLNRMKPELLNIADLSFFNFRPLIFITYPD